MYLLHCSLFYRKKVLANHCFLADVNRTTGTSYIFSDPNCVLIGNGCFLADPFCERYSIFISMIFNFINTIQEMHTIKH